MENKIEIPMPEFYSDIKPIPEIEEFVLKVLDSFESKDSKIDYHVEEILVSILHDPIIIESVAKILGII